MNFDYMKSATDFSQLYEYCCEAEEFALSKPNISVTSARKAMEYVVKLVFWWAAGDCPSMTVYEMATDPRFVQYVGDETLISCIHYIRKMGNLAVHEGNMTVEDALNVLEQLHFLAGELCIWTQTVQDYPEFEKPALPSAPVAVSPVPKAEPAVAAVKVEVAPELCAIYAQRMRHTIFNVKHICLISSLWNVQSLCVRNYAI